MTTATQLRKTDEAWRVARTAADLAAAHLGERLISAYAIGSLAHGGFSAAVSDVDVVLMVDRCDEEIPARMEAIAQRTRAERGKGLADRLSIFYGDWPSFAEPPATARMGAIDRLDLMDHGVLMRGEDRRTQDGTRPTRKELVAETARFVASQSHNPSDPAELVAAGPRVLTKTVLFPVRFLYTHATGRAGANEDAVAWYRANRGAHAALANAALAWRDKPIPREEAIPLLDAHLAGLWEECRETFVQQAPPNQAERRHSARDIG